MLLCISANVYDYWFLYHYGNEVVNVQLEFNHKDQNGHQAVENQQIMSRKDFLEMSQNRAIRRINPASEDVLVDIPVSAEHTNTIRNSCVNPIVVTEPVESTNKHSENAENFRSTSTVQNDQHIKANV